MSAINQVFNKFPRKIDLKTLGLILLTLVVLVEILFMWLFVKKQAPVIGFPSVKLPGQEAPGYLYSLGYQENNPEAALDIPLDVAVDILGRAFVTDTGHNCIKVYNAFGQFQFQFGLPGSEPGQLSSPVGIAISNNQIYVAETGNQRIQVFDLKGKFIKVFLSNSGNSEVGGITPSGINAAPNGDIYVTDIFQHRIIGFSPEGKVKVKFGKPGEEPGSFAYPNDIAVDRGLIYVTDSNNARVQVFDTQGKFLKVLQDKDPNNKLSLPRGIALAENRIYVVDTFNHTVNIMDKEGKVLNNFGEYGTENGQLNYPNGIAVFGDKFFITDRTNDRIAVFTY